ncbi:hypothetical protein J6590_048877 [Homalodisca vitripennis]|nr:hypothetical protein J6590_096026 [Homalodisca vitripennis]KAG8296802.1 hypothetical protein J6590_048877 [Homalodisca vitripennis]
MSEDQHQRAVDNDITVSSLTVPVLALLAPWARFLRRPLTAIQLLMKKGYRAAAQPRPTLTPLLLVELLVAFIWKWLNILTVMPSAISAGLGSILGTELHCGNKRKISLEIGLSGLTVSVHFHNIDNNLKVKNKRIPQYLQYIHLTIKLHRALNSAHQERVRFIYYSLWAWSIPLIFVIITMVMELTPIVPDAYLKPNFGQKSCWFHKREAAFPYFYAPIGLLLAANVCLFLLSISSVQTAVGQREEEELGLNTEQNPCSYSKASRRIEM